MTADIAKAHGWHLPKVAVQGLTQESDKLEDQLYKGTQHVLDPNSPFQQRRHAGEKQFLNGRSD
jgi:hypothetical protein